MSEKDGKGKTTRRRRLSIISLPNETKAETKEGVDSKGDGSKSGKGRRRRLSIVGLYTGEVIQAENVDPTFDKGDKDDDAPKFDLVKSFGYTSTAGYEPTGHKKTNQDAFIVLNDYAGVENQYLFGVFDGHGRVGHKASNYIASEIGVNFSGYMKSCQNISSAFKNSFVDLDRGMSKCDFDVKMSGTTGVVVFCRGDQLFVAWVGDSRAVLATEDKGELKAVELSIDQKPDHPEEKKRIEKAGGIVEPIIDPYEGPVGPARVWVKRQAIPGLAMSRSLGDKLAASVGCCAEPEVQSFKIQPSDQFMIIASDGVWEFITNEEAIDLIARYDDPQKGCDDLCAEAFKRWKAEEYVVDDITAIVVVFDQSPRP